jgi:hypothetical protein
MTFSTARGSDGTSRYVPVSRQALGRYIDGGAPTCYTIRMIAECNDAVCKRTLLMFYMKHVEWLKQRANIKWIEFCRDKCSKEGYDAWLKVQAEYEEGRKLKYQCSAILEQSNRKRGIRK